MRPRRTDLDPLRVARCGAVILRPAVPIFAAEPRCHSKAAVPWVSAPHEFLRVLAMPPFFALAVWAAVEPLRQRGLDAFAGPVPADPGAAARRRHPAGTGDQVHRAWTSRDLSLSGFRLVSPPTSGFGAFLPRCYTRMSLMT